MNPRSTSDFWAEYSSSKYKNRVQYHDNATGSTSNSSTTREPRSHSINNTSNTWYDDHRNHRKRERSRERDWSMDRKRTAYSRTRESSFREEESRDRLRGEQAPAYPSYNYTATHQSYVDNNCRALGMMADMSSYGLNSAMNSQWAMSPLAGMNTNNTVNRTTGISMNSNINMNTSGTNMNPYAFMGMSGHPNLFGMMGMCNFGQFGMMNNDVNMVSMFPKGMIRFSKSVLYPPNPDLPPPITRDKPPGCKTIFVGGLPEKVTEEVVREVFETCGEILTIWMSEKQFCHIRFASEACIDNALYFSGYCIKIHDRNEPPFVGRFYVDFAQARDDDECPQRSLQCEAGHRERIEQEYYFPPSVLPVVPYSDYEAAILGEKLRGEDTFQQAIFTLITWLERGECSKRNAGHFYSMIQSLNSRVRRLMNEKLKYEDELNKARMILRQQMRRILIQFTDIGKVFTAASSQKVWDLFTKPQRKNIDLWKKQTEEIKNAHVEEILGDRIEDDMQLSFDEYTASEKADIAMMLCLNHQECIEQKHYNRSTPPPVVPYSGHEATIWGEKLRSEDTFQQAISLLITWLERGECSKRNAGYFYSMIQGTDSHVRRLMNEKLKYEDELNNARMMLRQRMRSILIQLTNIGKVFTAASLQKVWDHFTKPQQKDIYLWKKQTEEIKNAHVEEVLIDRVEDDMELNDDGDTASGKAVSAGMVTDNFGNTVKDKPIQKRLSGAQKKKLTREKKMAAGTWEERPKMPKLQKGSDYPSVSKSQMRQQIPKQSSTKRQQSEDSTPLSESKPQMKRPKSNEDKGLSFKEGLTEVKMTVFLEGYPDQKLSKEQLGTFQLAIMDKIKGFPCGEGPKFKYCRLENGVIIIGCVDKTSSKWLSQTISEMNLWEGLKLKVGEGKKLVSTKIMFKVPNIFIKLSPVNILKKIEMQNAGLDCKEWTTLNKNGNIIVLRIPEKDAEVLKRRGYKFYIGLLQVQAQVLNKPASRDTNQRDQDKNDTIIKCVNYWI